MKDCETGNVHDKQSHSGKSTGPVSGQWEAGRRVHCQWVAVWEQRRATRKQSNRGPNSLTPPRRDTRREYATALGKTDLLPRPTGGKELSDAGLTPRRCMQRVAITRMENVAPKHPVLRCTWDAMPKKPQFLGHPRTRSRVRLSREVDARSPQAPTLSASPTAAYTNMRSKLSSATCVNSLVPISAGLAAPRTCRTHSRRSATCA